MSAKTEFGITIASLVQGFNKKFPCPKNKTGHDLHFYSDPHYVPTLWSDEVIQRGRCTHCKLEVYTTWTLHNIIAERPQL